MLFLYEQDESLSAAGSGAPAYVARIQRSLNKTLGLRLAPDGRLGVQTRSAIRSFQQRRGLAASGLMDAPTAARLHVDSGLAPPAAAGRAPACRWTVADCPPQGTSIDVLDHFGFNQATLNRPRHAPQLDRIARALVASLGGPQPIRSVALAGYADAVGNERYNTDLSRHRAEVVIRELCLAVNRIRPGASGAFQFHLAACGERAQRPRPELSRRVDVVVSREPGQPATGVPVLVPNARYGSIWVITRRRSPVVSAVRAPMVVELSSTPVANTLQVPFRWICLLEGHFSDSVFTKAAMATGFLISPRHVLTCGHCLTTRIALGGVTSVRKMDSVKVTPGRSGSQAPLGSSAVTTAAAIRVSDAWERSNATDLDADFGLLTLPQPMPRPGDFWNGGGVPRMAPSPTLAAGTVVRTAGYPRANCPTDLPCADASEA